MNLPRHVVLVPDGNRRWAKKRGKPSFFGHRAGMKSAERVFRAALDENLECLTFWGCSVNNLTERSEAEVKFLYILFDQAFRKFLRSMSFLKKHKIRVRGLGRWEEFFPAGLQRTTKKLVKETESFSGRNLTFLMAYNGMDEMVSAVRKVVKSGVRPEDVERDTIKRNLWTKDLPPVDLVVRTGGEPHWSAGLMMWEVAEAKLYFTNTTWPDFDPKELKKALTEYSRTERRFGK